MNENCEHWCKKTTTIKSIPHENSSFGIKKKAIKNVNKKISLYIRKDGRRR